MAALKNQPGNESVDELLASVEPEQKRQDCRQLLQIFRQLTKEEPVVWGGSMIGFGSYHYKAKSGYEADWFRTGFAARKTSITLYLLFQPKGFEQQLEKLGKYKTGKGCVYIKRLEDVDESVLTNLIKTCYLESKKITG